MTRVLKRHPARSQDLCLGLFEGDAAMNPAEFQNIAAAEQQFWWYRGMKRILFRLLDPVARRRSFQRVLDAGCGTGRLAAQLAERYHWRIFPVDIGWEGLGYARLLHPERLAQCDIAALPFQDAAFDLVLSMDVLIHFARGDEDRPMAEFARVLQRGGLCVVRVSALEALRSRHSQFAHERQRFTRSRLMRLAQRHGIRVLRCTYANALLLPVALAKFRAWEPLLRKPPQSGVRPVAPWLDSILYAPLRLEATLLGAGFNFLLGQSLLLIGQKQ
ncbi:MAG TPA: class I SAM-dependent methyltransferase [Bryobacteraceae bacterium]|nr:class I SAM-dependent methyltransferase [Bryobacteraceae bacterium]